MQEIRNPNLILRIMLILSNLDQTLRPWNLGNLAKHALS